MVLTPKLIGLIAGGFVGFLFVFTMLSYIHEFFFPAPTDTPRRAMASHVPSTQTTLAAHVAKTAAQNVAHIWEGQASTVLTHLQASVATTEAAYDAVRLKMRTATEQEQRALAPLAEYLLASAAEGKAQITKVQILLDNNLDLHFALPREQRDLPSSPQ